MYHVQFDGSRISRKDDSGNKVVTRLSKTNDAIVTMDWNSSELVTGRHYKLSENLRSTKRTCTLFSVFNAPY